MTQRTLPFLLSFSLLGLASPFANAQINPTGPGAGVPPGATPTPRVTPAPPSAPVAPLAPARAPTPALGPTVAPPPQLVPGPALAPASTPDAPFSIPVRPLPDRPSPTLRGLETEPGGLTSAQVARRALAVSPSVKQKMAEVVQANERVNQTIISFLPKLTLLASYTRISNVNVSFGNFYLAGANAPGPLQTGPCADGTGATCVFSSRGPSNQANQVVGAALTIPTVADNYNLTARLSIPLSDYVLRLADASGATRASHESARLEVLAEKLRVASDARTLYYNWLRSRAEAVIAKNTVESTRARLTDAQAQFTVGQSSKADLMRIQALVANAELLLDAAESALNLTTGQLAIVMEDWHPNYRVGEGIPEPGSIADANAPLDKLIAEGHARRLEVRAMDEAVRALTYGASDARAGALPHLDAIGDATLANPNPRYFPPQPAWHTTWSVGVQASWTIADTFAQSSRGREYDAQAQAMMAQRTLVRAGIANEVLGTYLDLSRARAALDKRRVALDAAQEAYRVTTDLFRAGRATGTDLVQAELSLLQASVGEVNSRIDLAIAAVQLEHATGRDATAAFVAGR